MPDSGIYNSSSIPINARIDHQPEIVGVLRDVPRVKLQVVTEKELNAYDEHR